MSSHVKKKIAAGCLFILFTTFLSKGACDIQSRLPPKKAALPATPLKAKAEPIVEIKGGYFVFADAKMRKVFDEGGIDLQISQSFPIKKWLQIYGSVEYLERHGHSMNEHQKASIWEIPVSLGLKSVITLLPKVQYYLTLGPRTFYVHAHILSSYVNWKINHVGLGGFVNTGFNFTPTQRLRIDLFGEYSYQRMHFRSSESNVYGRGIQIGGLSFGGGLGYAF